MKVIIVQEESGENVRERVTLGERGSKIEGGNERKRSREGVGGENPDCSCMHT